MSVIRYIGKHWKKSIVCALLLLFYGALITYQIVLPAAEDLPRQIMNGHDIVSGNFDVIYKNVYSYTNPDHSFANHHWLYGVIMYGMDSLVGFDGIVVFKIVLLLGTLGLLIYTASRRANFWLVAICAIPTIIMIMGRSAARPEMFSYAFTVLYLYLLTHLEDHPQSRKVFWIVPLQLLWANIHILFPAGVAIVGAFAVVILFKHWKGALHHRLVRKVVILLVLTTAISFANPLGIGGVIYSLKANTVGATKEVFSAEVQSIADVFRVEPKADYPGPALFLPMVILLGLSFVLRYKRIHVGYLLLTGAFAFLSFRIIRGVPMFALVFLPAISSNLDPLYQRLVGALRTRWRDIYVVLSYIGPALLIVLLLYMTFVWRPRELPYQIFGIGLTSTSNDPVRFFTENNLKGPILNDIDSGSYLIYHLYPQEKVFADNRFADAYTQSFLQDEYDGLFTDEAIWTEMLAKYQFNVIILNHYNRGSGVSDFIYNRVYDPAWVWVYAGRDVVIFVRNIKANEKVIAVHAIVPDNFEQKLEHLINADDYAGRVAGADLFAYIGNTKRAIVEYEKIVSRWPMMGKIWFLIGRNELLRADQANADTAKALLALQRAIKEGYKTPYAYSYLALAYFRLGDIEQTERAVKKELQIDPDIADGQAWKDLIIREKLRRIEISQ